MFWKLRRQEQKNCSEVLLGMDCWWIMKLLRDVNTKRYKNDKVLKLRIKTSIKKMSEVLTEVLPQKNYNKVLLIIEYLEKNGEITLQAAEIVSRKTKSTVYRYLSMLAKMGYVEVSGNTNNAV